MGGLAGWEVLGKDEELVLAVALAMSLCSSFLLFRRFGWFFLFSKDSHGVQCVIVGSDGRIQNVQRGTVFGVKKGL